MSETRIPKSARGPWGPPYGEIMADMADMRCSALHLARRHNWTREEASRLLANLRRAGFVEYQGAWQITAAGRAAILPTDTIEDLKRSRA